jgi:hypothetical protein
MTNWEQDFEWNRTRHLVKDILGIPKPPDVNAMLFLIGMQELGRIKPNFTKEEKQDLMHLAVCRLLSYDGYYEFVGRDADDWPHYKLVAGVPKAGETAQEDLLKTKIVQYFKEWETEAESVENWQGEI